MEGTKLIRGTVGYITMRQSMCPGVRYGDTGAVSILFGQENIGNDHWQPEEWM